MAKKKTEFEKRLEPYYDELKWLYYELYHDDYAAFDYFIEMLKRMESERSLRHWPRRQWRWFSVYSLRLQWFAFFSRVS